jgi:hypothetical protein
MKNIPAKQFSQGTIDLGANNMLISIRETAMYGSWAAERI